MRSVRTAIIGCGKIADQHVDAIQSISNVEIVAVVDREGLMASQLAERRRISNWYQDHREMLRDCQPDIVHITTPPLSHYGIGMDCVRQGSSIYVEKPFTVNTDEARELIAEAQKNRAKVTVGHNLQFSDEAIRMRRLLRAGALGESGVRHIEVIQGYGLGGDYARAFLSDKQHWLHKLPGQLIQNLMSHGIAKLAEHLSGSDVSVVAQGHSSDEMLGLGGAGIHDEVRAMLRDERKTTAHYVFTSQVGAAQFELRLYGASGAIFVNQSHQSTIRVARADYKAQLNYIFPLFRYAREYAREGVGNMRRLFWGHLRLDSGMRRLMRLFYQSVRADAMPPITDNEILRNSMIMDRIIEQAC